MWGRKETEKGLRRLLRPGEPPILSLVKDLEVDSAGARRRRVASSNCRLAKARQKEKIGEAKMQSPAKQPRLRAQGFLPRPPSVINVKALRRNA